MKKLFIAVLCLALCLSLSACAIEPISNTGSGTQPSQSVDGNGSGEGDKTSSSDLILGDGELVLIDTEECSVTVLEVDNDAPEELTIELAMENKTDKTLDFYCDGISINKWQLNSFFWEALEPGATGSYEMEFYSFELEDAQVDSVDEVSMHWQIFHSDSWMDDSLIDDMFTFSASGLASDEIEVKERPEGDITKETVIFDDDRFTYIITEINENNFAGPEVVFYIENKTDTPVVFKWDNVTVNNWAIIEYVEQMVLPGCRIISNHFFTQQDFTLRGIEQIDSLSIDISVQDDEYNEIDSSSASIYPTGKSAEDIPAPTRTPKDGETVLVDNDQCAVILEPMFIDNSTYYYGLYINNKTDEELLLDISDFIANGDTEILFIDYRTLPPGCQTYSLISVFDFDLQYSSSRTLESLEFKLELTSSDFSNPEPIFSDTVSVTN